MPVVSYFKLLLEAMLQIFLLGAVGFFLVRKKVVSEEGLNGLTRLLIEVVFPSLIFWQIITKFDFQMYANWWVFGLLSIGIIATGFFVGWLISLDISDNQVKKEMMSLVAFQNSGYLPLTLIGWIVPPGMVSIMLIYLFLFLLGFNLVIWSWGVYFLSNHKAKYFSLMSLFSPPVIATCLGFLFVLLRINTRMPAFVLRPLEMLGGCSFPLAIIVVGASLADLSIGKKIEGGLVSRVLFAKLLVLPLAGLLIVAVLKLPYLIGFLLMLQLAVPSATTLAVIVRRYVPEERIISQSIFISHLVSLITLPVFMAAYNWIVLK